MNNLRTASTGYDALFSNDLEKARIIFGTKDSSLHLLGVGVCTFLEAALGMEVRCLSLHRTRLAVGIKSNPIRRPDS